MLFILFFLLFSVGTLKWGAAQGAGSDSQIISAPAGAGAHDTDMWPSDPK